MRRAQQSLSTLAESAQVNITCQGCPESGLNGVTFICLHSCLSQSPDGSCQKEHDLDKVVSAAEARPKDADSWRLPAGPGSTSFLEGMSKTSPPFLPLSPSFSLDHKTQHKIDGTDG